MSKKISVNSTKEISTSTNSWSKWFPYFLGLITFFVYLNSIQNGYNLDDELVTRNHPLTSNGLSTIWEIFTSPYYSDDMGYNYGYRPMVHLSFAIENHFFGESPHVGHFINLLIYMLIVVLAFKFLIKLFGIDYQNIAFFAMLIFAVHPVHTEVVNSLKNRDELLALFFALISLSFLMKQNFSEKKYLWFLLFCIFLICSVLSKKSSIPIFFCAPILFVNNSKFQPLHYFIFSLILNFLVAIFGSDFNTILSVKLFLIGGALSISFFLVKNRTIWQKSIPESFVIKNSYSLLLITSFLLLFIFSIFFRSFEVLIVAYAFLIVFVFLEITKKELISFIVVFSLFVSGLFFKIDELSEIAVMLCMFILFDLAKKAKAKEVKLNFSYLVWFIPILINYNGVINFDQFTGYLLQLIILLLIYKYEWSKYMILLVSGLMIAFYRETELREILFLLMLFYDKFRFLEKIKVSYYHFVILGVITFFIIGNNKKQTIDLENISKTEIAASRTNKIISEGRELNFVENPLVNSTENKRKVMIGFETTGLYLKLLIFPYPLKFYYGYNVIQTNSNLSFELIIGILFFILLFVFVSILLKNNNFYLLFLVLSLLLSFLMFSNWYVLVAGIIGERLIFEASFLFVYLFVFILYKSNFFSELLNKVILVTIIILFSVITINRNLHWKDTVSLMSNDIKFLQNSAQANNLLALNLMKISTSEENHSQEQRLEMQKMAVLHFQKAIEIYPKFSNAWYDLGRAKLEIRDTTGAISAFENAIYLMPLFSDSYYNLLAVFESQNNRLKHLYFSRKLNKNVSDPEAIIIMAKSYVANNKIDSAFIVLNKGLNSFKNNSRILSNIKELKVYNNLISK